MKSLRSLSLVLAAFLFLSPAQAQAQDYPNRAVKIIIGAGAGGSTDLVARVIAQDLSRMWGVPVLVENRGGASGTTAADAVAKGDADGYTIFGGSLAPVVVAASRERVTYDPLNDFAQAILISTYPLSIVVQASSPIKDIRHLIEEARARPGKLNYGSGGVGSSSHLFMEMLNSIAGIKTTNVPYRGGAPALNGLLAGETEFAGVALTIVVAQGDKLRPLAVTSEKASRFLPGVPGVGEILPGYDARELIMFQLPAKTPRAIVEKVNRDVNAALQSAEVKASMDRLTMDVQGGSIEDATDYIRRNIARWRPVIQATGLSKM